MVPTAAKKIGIIYNAREPDARAMCSTLIGHLGLSERCWTCSSSDVGPDIPEAKGTDLIVTIGGDGTIIRAASVSVPHSIPMLGINMGRLGFMTELEAEEAMEMVPRYLEGMARVEERCMLQVTALPAPRGDGAEASGDMGSYHALNDAVVGRGAVSRLVKIGAFIDGVQLTDFRADAVIVATATGSTGYNLSVGGPILSPEAGEIILKAVAPHVGMAPALVLSSTSVVELVVDTDYQTILSVDGYVDVDLAPGDGVRVQMSPRKARFLRAYPPGHFYATLTRRLGFGGGQSTTRAIQY